MKKLMAVAMVALASPVVSAQYSIDWHKIAGGGGVSTGRGFSLDGAIGQHDAGVPMSGGNFSLTGGFWAFCAVRTPGMPWLSIRRISPNSVVVSWPGSGACRLQTNNNPTTADWVDYAGAVVLANGTNSVTITPPAGNLFFRLK